MYPRGFLEQGRRGKEFAWGGRLEAAGRPEGGTKDAPSTDGLGPRPRSAFVHPWLSVGPPAAHGVLGRKKVSETLIIWGAAFGVGRRKKGLPVCGRGSTATVDRPTHLTRDNHNQWSEIRVENSDKEDWDTQQVQLMSENTCSRESSAFPDFA